MGVRVYAGERRAGAGTGGKERDGTTPHRRTRAHTAPHTRKRYFKGGATTVVALLRPPSPPPCSRFSFISSLPPFTPGPPLFRLALPPSSS